jgi:hypothetical protein
MRNQTDKAIELSLFGIIAVIITCVAVACLDNVGTYQLDATYSCSIEFTEAEHKARCRNELDGFGHLLVLGAKS